LKLIAARNDHSYVCNAEVEQEAKVVEVAVVKFGLVIPFQFERNLALEAINTVGRAFDGLIVDDDPSIEPLLLPSFGLEHFVHADGYEALPAILSANFTNVTAQNVEVTKNGDNVR
jgi:hypothetical protein